MNLLATHIKSMNKPLILILCTGNSCRSQMAEYFLRDAVGDIEESMRREALISLSSTVNKMAVFTKNITSKVEDIKQLATDLNEGKKRSGEVVSANEGIRALSINFGENISVSRNLISIVLGVIIVVTMVSVFLLTRAITKPLSRSIQIADGIASGNLDQKVDITGKDEFGQLGKAMATMIKNLKKISSKPEISPRKPPVSVLHWMLAVPMY